MNGLMNLENNQQKWTSRDISEWTGKEHKNVIRDIRDEIEKLNEGGLENFAKLNFEFSEYQGISDNQIRKYPIFNLTKLGIQQIAMRYDAVIRAKVNQKLEEFEKQSLFTEKQLPRNYKEALLYLIQSEEEKEQIQLERDEAVRTKTLIGSKREATAMATASTLSKKIKKITEYDFKPGEYSAHMIAYHLGIISKNGKPHAQLIGAYKNFQEHENPLTNIDSKYWRSAYQWVEGHGDVQIIIYKQIFYDYCKRYLLPQLIGKVTIKILNRAYYYKILPPFAPLD